jgi:hypothetical protein
VGKRKRRQTVAALAQERESLHEVADFWLTKLGLSDHWHPNDDAYIAAQKKLREKAYWDAINELESQVVRRLFELQKCHVKRTSKA